MLAWGWWVVEPTDDGLGLTLLDGPFQCKEMAATSMSCVFMNARIMEFGLRVVSAKEEAATRESPEPEVVG